MQKILSFSSFSQLMLCQKATCLLLLFGCFVLSHQLKAQEDTASKQESEERALEAADLSAEESKETKSKRAEVSPSDEIQELPESGSNSQADKAKVLREEGEQSHAMIADIENHSRDDDAEDGSAQGDYTEVTYQARAEYMRRSLRTDHHSLSQHYQDVKQTSGFSVPFASMGITQRLSSQISIRGSVHGSTRHHRAHSGIVLEDLYLHHKKESWDLDFYFGRFAPSTGGILGSRGYFHIHQFTPSYFHAFAPVEGIKSTWFSDVGDFTFSITDGQSHLFDSPRLATAFSYPLLGIRYQVNWEGLLLSTSYHRRRSKGAYLLESIEEVALTLEDLPKYHSHTTSYLSYGLGFFRGAIEASVDINHYRISSSSNHEGFGYKERIMVVEASYLHFPWKPFIHASVNSSKEQKALSHIHKKSTLWTLGTHFYITDDIAYYISYSLSTGETIPTIYQEKAAQAKTPYPYRHRTLLIGLKASGSLF